MQQLLELRIDGISETSVVLGVAADSLKDQIRLYQAMIRPMKRPDGRGWVIDPQYTFEGATRRKFEQGGRNTYDPNPWEAYANEPRYAKMKAHYGGGSRVLIWEGAKDPLFETLLNPDHPEHIEAVKVGFFQFGTRRWYARRLHLGGFWQPWDKVFPKARPILRLSQRAGVEFARGAQRLIIADLAVASGMSGSPGAKLNRVRPGRRR
mgnify:CR=1 FL=1